MESKLISNYKYQIIKILWRYDSLKFGVEQRGETFSIIDSETGELLGGKKAAIQYYYDSKYKMGSFGKEADVPNTLNRNDLK